MTQFWLTLRKTTSFLSVQMCIFTKRLFSLCHKLFSICLWLKFRIMLLDFVSFCFFFTLLFCRNLLETVNIWIEASKLLRIFLRHSYFCELFFIFLALMKRDMSSVVQRNTWFVMLLISYTPRLNLYFQIRGVLIVRWLLLMSLSIKNLAFGGWHWI